jgi:nucleolar MIF4G domain-containing protein 1
MAESSKSSLNLLTLIAELYNAQVIGANLIYDLIRSLLAETPREAAIMGEIQVEGLLKLLRCSGQQLRSDDPASLKDIVNLVQDKTKGKEKTMT